MPQISGENNPMYGKDHSEIAKRKIREARAKQVFTKESITKRGKSLSAYYRLYPDSLIEKGKKSTEKLLEYYKNHPEVLITKRLKSGGVGNPNWKGRGTTVKSREILAGRKKPEQCEVCGAIGIICFDHDHETGRFRGWICHRCNAVLGFVKDNGELLVMLKDYLIKSKSNG